MSFIPLAKNKKHLARKKVECQMINIPKSLPGSLITNEEKRHAEDHAPNNPPPKIQNQGRSSSLALKDDHITIPEELKAEGGPLSTKDDLIPQFSFWSDLAFDAAKFNGSRILFPKELNICYKAIHNMSPLKQSDLSKKGS